MSSLDFDQLICLDVVKMTGLRDSSYFAPCSLLVGQSQDVFLGVKCEAGLWPLLYHVTPALDLVERVFNLEPKRPRPISLWLAI